MLGGVGVHGGLAAAVPCAEGDGIFGRAGEEQFAREFLFSKYDGGSAASGSACHRCCRETAQCTRCGRGTGGDLYFLSESHADSYE